ncbi:tripartite AtP-independent periplasmic transporter subunit DctQ [Nitratireductor indicus C115]|uniref:TRAP transporter small permease protein n=1 Tax=Nitratireductor indicus C115 TaxID=1231190 RepID=K2NSG6_9HYPH|nr:TRAP transporter small permease [Nitratireductor indicus]EKF40714.1 tripartite AtP-independent periplasmic transporter subunit DctQ [Nitratireductor indicus C115]SFQ76122.1 TRAP-type C4-dicarboxylate transport system, small permease component [Nitratireductor indicus]
MSFILRDAEKIACAVIFLAMTALGFVNVVVRYTTSYSLASSEELLTNGFLLLTILGAAIAARNGDHLAVTLFFELLPKPLRKLVLVLAGILSVLLLALSAWFSWVLVSNQMSSGIRSYALQIPAWYYSVGMPFGFALILIRYVQHILDTWKTLSDEEPRHV